jgi:8-oxo-dGTP pyrophosphatase MutT (NUDIX family)
MGFDPQKFFIGLTDFFTIMLPGALLAYLGKDQFARWIDRSSFPLNDAESVSVFLVGSYLLGHLLFLLSAELDELVYDRLRGLTPRGQRVALSKGLMPASTRARAWGRRLFGDGADAALERILSLKARALGPLEADKAVNAFQWCKAHLTSAQPAAMNTVQRFEADSKFFRSMVVALPVLALLYAIDLKMGRAVACLAATVPTLWRYIDQRFKATQQAYWSILTLVASREGDWPPAAAPAKGGLTHAGGVVFRQQPTLQFMLVRSQGLVEEWVLPKGHIEPGESAAMTAVREVAEESGAWARILSALGEQLYAPPSGAEVRVRWFLMEWVGDRASAESFEGREVVFLSPPDAVARATFHEAKTMLEKAEGMLAGRQS